jgi:hypothetical protein
MIDNLSILLSHALLALLFWFLLGRDDLDTEMPPPMDDEPEGFSKQRINPKVIKKQQASPGAEPGQGHRDA